MGQLVNAWHWYVAHRAEVHEIIAGVLLVLNVVVTFMLRLAPLTNWVNVAEKSPRLAAVVRLLGALGIQPVQLVQALVDLLRGSVSPGTLASAKTLQISSSAPLIAPPSPKKDSSQ
jgi:hypothetical protein